MHILLITIDLKLIWFSIFKNHCPAIVYFRLSQIESPPHLYAGDTYTRSFISFCILFGIWINVFNFSGLFKK